MESLTLAIPVMGQLNDCKSYLAWFKHVTSPDVEFMIIDNGSSDDYESFLTKYLKPKKLNYIRNEENLGLVKTLQQAYENCNTDILTVVHNDMTIFEDHWDYRIRKYFEDIPSLGIAGLFGSQGCGPIGERIQDVPRPDVMSGISNMLEAEIHGMRMTQDWRAVSIFDGFFMAFSMEMLRKGNGFDQRYIYHHIYDRDIALESLRRGYNNIVVNIPSHHWSGMTANRPEYQTWIDKKTEHKDYTGDKFTHDQNSELFKEKWKDMLPLYVEDDFSLRNAGQFNGQPFKTSIKNG